MKSLYSCNKQHGIIRFYFQLKMSSVWKIIWQMKREGIKIKNKVRTDQLRDYDSRTR